MMPLGIEIATVVADQRVAEIEAQVGGSGDGDFHRAAQIEREAQVRSQARFWRWKNRDAADVRLVEPIREADEARSYAAEHADAADAAANARPGLHLPRGATH